MPLEFIDQDTIIQMTRKIYPKVQAKYLREKLKIPYTFNGDGKLNVLVSDYLKKHGLKDSKVVKKEEEPEFDAIRNINGKKTAKKQASTA